MKYFLAAFLLFSVGCATSSGVVEMGKDSFMITREASQWGGSSKVKADAIREASAYCKEQGKQSRITFTQDTPPNFTDGAKTEVQFYCLSEGDPRLNSGGPMVPVTASPVDKIIGK